MFGHHGNILRVDLSAGSIERDSCSPDFARCLLGGNGFAAKLIADGVPPEADPLGPGNAIAFAVGPLTGTPVWGTSRCHVAGISPLTGFFADSSLGGGFGLALKQTGFDAVVITGQSPVPVYLLVTEDGGEIRSAEDVWGRTTEQADSAIRAREGRDAVCALIGPAGEKQVLFANILGGGVRSGAAGRCGMGAIMGAKRLKAVVASGRRKTQIADAKGLKAFLAEKLATLREHTEVLTDQGTPVLVKMINERGLLGTHNAARGTFEFADDIGSEVLKEKYITKNVACPGCPVACGKLVRVPGDEPAGQTTKMPEYETIYALGPMLDNRDIESIIHANALCDQYGLDTISMGVTLSFVAECMERGLVTEADLGGRVDFGDGGGMLQLVQATAAREGIGELLAMGSERLARRFGPETRRYLYAVKGLEIPGHSAIGLRPMGLGYATSTRGGSHHDTRPSYPVPDKDPGFEGQVEYGIRSQNFTAVGDSLVMCRFVEERGFGSGNNEDVATVLNLVTGWDVTVEELDRIGERIYNLERVVSVGRGVSRDLDVLPHRVMHEPIPDGPAKGRCCPPEQLNAMLDEYYRRRGWSPEGIPTPEKLSDLGLS